MLAVVFNVDPSSRHQEYLNCIVVLFSQYILSVYVTVRDQYANQCRR